MQRMQAVTLLFQSSEGIAQSLAELLVVPHFHLPRVQCAGGSEGRELRRYSPVAHDPLTAPLSTFNAEEVDATCGKLVLHPVKFCLNMCQFLLLRRPRTFRQRCRRGLCCHRTEREGK